MSSSSHALRARRPSLGAHLLALAAVAVLPALVAGGITAWNLAEVFRRSFEANLRDEARYLSQTVDKEVELHLAALRALAASPLLEEPDLGGFDRQARQLSHLLGSFLTVVDGGLKHRVDTRLPSGVTPYAEEPPTGPVARAIATGRPVVSDFLPSRGEGGSGAFAVVLPVPRDGRAPMALDLPLPVHRVQRLLDNARDDTSGYAMLLDDAGRIAGLTRSADASLGQAVPDWVTAANGAGQQEGVVQGVSPSGTEVLVAFRRLEHAPWTVAVAEPLNAYHAAWRRPLADFAGISMLLVTVAGVAALMLARGLTRPLSLLAQHAEAVAARRGRRPLPEPPSPSAVAEIETLRRALLRAEAALQHAAEAERQAAQRQRLLAGELSHRVKNALAVVQAVSAATFRVAPTLAEFRPAFEGRLQALARAHGLLLRSAWQTADFADLLEGELAPFRGDGGGSDAGGTITVQGPPVMLSPRQGLSLGLILHELATNAAKHGALAPGSPGQLRVLWRVERDDGEEQPSSRPQRDRLVLLWEETALASAPALATHGAKAEPAGAAADPVGSGGVRRGTEGQAQPKRAAPPGAAAKGNQPAGASSGGLGERLIRRLAAYDLAGRAELEREPNSLRWRLSIPLG